MERTEPDLYEIELLVNVVALCCKLFFDLVIDGELVLNKEALLPDDLGLRFHHRAEAIDQFWCVHTSRAPFVV